jgi:hypothetical protein
LSAPLSRPWIPHVHVPSSCPTQPTAILTNFHLLDYQVTSNSWTFLEANVAIIVTCLPTIKGPITRLFPCLDPHKKSSTTGYPDGFSRNNYTSKNIISSHGRSRVGADKSDEEFILHNVEPVKVRMTTDIDITFQDTKKMDMEIATFASS